MTMVRVEVGVNKQSYILEKYIEDRLYSNGLEIVVGSWENFGFNILRYSE